MNAQSKTTRSTYLKLIVDHDSKGFTTTNQEHQQEGRFFNDTEDFNQDPIVSAYLDKCLQKGLISTGGDLKTWEEIEARQNRIVKLELVEA